MSEPIITKRCSHCKEIKGISEFSKNKFASDGIHYQCKTCRKLALQRYYATEKGKACIERYKKTKKGKETARKYRESHQEQITARNRVDAAVKSKKLLPAKTLKCSGCDEQAQEYHHHKGYAPEHWLDIIPVCIQCHVNLHRLLPVHCAG